MPQVISFGEPIIDMFAHPIGVPLREAECLIPAPGGGPANVSVALGRLGVDVGFVGAVGSDPYGAWLADILQSSGVDTNMLFKLEDAPTTLAIVAVTSPEDQEFIFSRGADTRITIRMLDRDAITRARLFIYGSVTLTGNSKAACLEASNWTKGGGGRILFDANFRKLLWPTLDAARERIMASVRTADICKVNETELVLLSGTDDFSEGSRLILNRGPRLVAVTLGAKGAFFSNGHVEGLVPGFPVKAVDTTGCGDAFVAGLALGLLEADCPVEALTAEQLTHIVRFANALGALTATRKGAMAALPTRPAVEAFLNAQEAAPVAGGI